VPHDSWVVGETRHVSLYLLGADEYAKEWRGRWRRLASAVERAADGVRCEASFALYVPRP